MSKIDRKTRIREYKETAPAAGVYQIKNTATGRSLLGAALNPAGRLNRHRFQLKAGSHPQPDLQADWNELGEEAFEFTVLDRLEPQDDASVDANEELDVLKQMWLDKLAAAGQALYAS